MEKVKYIVIIQCAIAKKRCSGFLCMESFFERKKFFEEYPKDKDIKILSFDCGGCCGDSINTYLANFKKKLKQNTDINLDEVVVHLSSCISFDNHHSDRCPFIDRIKASIKKQGIEIVKEGTQYIESSHRKRGEGVYKKY